MSKSSEGSTNFKIDLKDKEDITEAKRCLDEFRNVWMIQIGKEVNEKLNSLPAEDRWIKDLFYWSFDDEVEVQKEKFLILFDKSFEEAVSRLSELWNLPESEVEELIRIHRLCFEVEKLLE